MCPRHARIPPAPSSDASRLGGAEPRGDDSGSHPPPHDQAQKQRADKTTVRPPASGAVEGA